MADFIVRKLSYHEYYRAKHQKATRLFSVRAISALLKQRECQFIINQRGASQKAEQGKALATKPDDLSSIPGSPWQKESANK